MQTTNNNTLGLNSETVSAILTLASTLQKNYENVGATPHQNVRNPFPMHKLIMNTLPTSKSKAMTRGEIRASLQSFGYRATSLYVASAISRLVKSGAVKCEGNTNSKFCRYWFAF